MKIITIGLIALGFSACKKSNISKNLGSCKSIYETSSSTITINVETSGTFCLLDGLDYQLDVTTLYLTNIEWNTGDSTNSISANEPGTYSGFGLNSNNDTIDFLFEAINCRDNLYTPNVFTPNGDGQNDNWKPHFAYSTVCDENYQLNIFDTYHQLIFKTNDTQFSWDATYKGSASPQGIYHYLIEYKREDGEVLKKSGQFLLMK